MARIADPTTASTPRHVRHPEWSLNASIYEVNVRQFTPEGTLAAFEAHLPRIAAMGVGIVWLMPIHPVGVKNRKGTLGSGYSVRDYCAVNPEFGTLDDLRRVVRATHALGMRLIIDWVANHTAWDHAWVTEHPEWYQKDARGRIHGYRYDNGKVVEEWSDVVGLDYAQPGLADAMIDAMKYWVREADIDGFRCDVAALVPTAVWDRARAELDAIKPVFMLAEASTPGHHVRAFDMSYDWALFDAMLAIRAGAPAATTIRRWWDERSKLYAANDIRMLFTSNHDKNSWNGSDHEFYGEGFQAFAVLAATLPGMPLVYGGQEAGLDKRIAFFEKDTIDWRDLPLEAFYAELLQLKNAHPALANGAAGAPLQWIDAGSDDIVAFRRAQGGQALRVVLNLSPRAQRFEAQALAPWAWRIDRLP